jgi:thiamine-monophosphate kinase
MNAIPEQITVSIAVSGKFSVEALEELYAGIYMACEKYHIDLIGGDTTSSMTGLMISITALGRVKKEDLVYRSGARLNDLICVSGDLGAAYLGLQLLEREKLLFEKDPEIKPDFSGKDYLLERQLKPEPRADILSLLRKNGIRPTSMIDISDGLSSDLLHICENSGTGCRIYQDRIPIDTVAALTADEFGIEPVICALHGGEDYELLFTVPLADYQKISGLRDIHMIGHITGPDEKAGMITKNGDLVGLSAQGWDNMKPGTRFGMSRE